MMRWMKKRLHVTLYTHARKETHSWHFLMQNDAKPLTRLLTGSEGWMDERLGSK